MNELDGIIVPGGFVLRSRNEAVIWSSSTEKAIGGVILSCLS